mgnify:CR=1 FL=1
MASRFWVGGTGTWDAVTTTNWSATSGGAGGASVPGSADTVTFDGASGGGTVTVNFGGLITIQQLDCSAFTGTLDFATNNNSITLTLSGTAFFCTGAATKTLNMGSGTWTLSGTNAAWNMNTAANLTLVPGTSTIAFTGSGNRSFIGGGKTINALTVAAASSTGGFTFSSSSVTIGSLTITGQNVVVINQGFTVNITTLTVSGTSASAPVCFSSSNPGSAGAVVTLAVTNNFTGSWLSLLSVTFTTGTHTANNSFGFITSGITVNAPSGGGGVVGVIGG